MGVEPEADQAFVAGALAEHLVFLLRERVAEFARGVSGLRHRRVVQNENALRADDGGEKAGKKGEGEVLHRVEH